MKRLAWLFLAVGAAACGGGTVTGSDASVDGGNPPSDGSSTFDANFGDAGTFCGAKQARDQSCSTTFDPTACLQLQACVEAVLRPETAVGYETCLVTRACGVADDKCIGAEEAKFLQDPATTKFRTDCFARKTACLEAGASFADDNCATFGVFKDSFRASWADCLTKPCDQISACFGNLAKGANCK